LSQYDIRFDKIAQDPIPNWDYIAEKVGTFMDIVERFIAGPLQKDKGTVRGCL
jgi:hypothetical protein